MNLNIKKLKEKAFVFAFDNKFNVENEMKQHIEYNTMKLNNSEKLKVA